MTGSPYYLQLGGVWVQLDGIDPGVSYTSERPSSETVSVGGVRRTQVAGKAPRTWGWSMGNDVDQAPMYLTLAAQGRIGDVYLYDAAAAQVNMLAPSDCDGEDTTQPTIIVNSLIPMRTFAAGYTLTMSLRGAVTYHLSGTTSHTAAATLGTYNIGAGAVNIVAPAGTGARRWTTSFTPAAAATVTVIMTVAGVTSALRLTEGNVDSLGFVPGMKAVCQVSVSDPQQTLSMVFTTRLPLSDYAVVLREVG